MVVWLQEHTESFGLSCNRKTATAILARSWGSQAFQPKEPGEVDTPIQISDSKIRHRDIRVTYISRGRNEN